MQLSLLAPAFSIVGQCQNKLNHSICQQIEASLAGATFCFKTIQIAPVIICTKQIQWLIAAGVYCLLFRSTLPDLSAVYMPGKDVNIL